MDAFILNVQFFCANNYSSGLPCIAYGFETIDTFSGMPLMSSVKN